MASMRTFLPSRGESITTKHKCLQAIGYIEKTTKVLVAIPCIELCRTMPHSMWLMLFLWDEKMYDSTHVECSLCILPRAVQALTNPEGLFISNPLYS